MVEEQEVVGEWNLRTTEALLSYSRILFILELHPLPRVRFLIECLEYAQFGVLGAIKHTIVRLTFCLGDEWVQYVIDAKVAPSPYNTT